MWVAEWVYLGPVEARAPLSGTPMVQSLVRTWASYGKI